MTVTLMTHDDVKQTGKEIPVYFCLRHGCRISTGSFLFLVEIDEGIPMPLEN